MTWAPWQPGDGAASARAVLLTLLGEFVLPAGGRAWTSTLIDAMAALELEPKATRQALARSAAAGLLTSERCGRLTRWALTDSATAVLTAGTERIYRFGREVEPWDGTWLLVVARVPETNRRLRYRLRTRLAWHGLAPIAPGVWLSPWVSHQDDALAALADLGLASEALSFVAGPGTHGPTREQVYRVWDVAAIEADYEAFIAVTEERAPADDAEAFVALAALVHDWRHFPAADPGLPESLLPEPWNGQTAAAVFHDRHRRWRAPAWRWWRAHAGDT